MYVLCMWMGRLLVFAENERGNHMDKKEIKCLCSFFLVIILLICYGWYRTENARIKQIESLQTRVEELEEELRICLAEEGHT